MKLNSLPFVLGLLGALPAFSYASADGKNITYTISSAGSQPHERPTYQLTLLRNLNIAEQECIPTLFSETQRHRLLASTKDEVLVESRVLEDWNGPHDLIKVFGYEPEKIWKKAEEICSDATEFQVGGSRLFREDSESKQAPLQAHRTSKLKAFRKSPEETKPPPLKVLPLLVSGQSGNRVDFVFFSDGYTANEEDKFFHDAARFALDMSQNHTFWTVQYMINFWAAFTPSEESGIGVGGKPKNTTYGLYRDGTELRAVYTSKSEIARAACASLRFQCDYPILLGNDPYYGGLGGEFVISTASDLNGALVLRHELGHSVIDVGEEYDGGFAYFGVNAAQDPGELSYEFPWRHWLTDPSSPRAERSIMPFQAYPWTLLNKSDAWSAKFTSAGTYSRHLVRFSLSGLPDARDLTVKLDGRDLGWEPRPGVGLDRWHYDIPNDEALEEGEHELIFELGESAKEGKAQLCSAEIIEYGDENEFNSTAGNYGAYPTFSVTNTTTYRPTNEQCLMRLVTSPKFCNVCKEGLWTSIMKRVSLIDSLTVAHWHDDSQRKLKYMLIVMLTGLPPPEKDSFNGEQAYYTINWHKDGVLLPQYVNQTSIQPMDVEVVGNWTVSIELFTPEVRKDPYHLLRAFAHVEVLEVNSEPRVTFI